MQRTTYPYCPHGKYVGGCGIDHLCHYCELGDTEPTVRELREMLRDQYTHSSQRIQHLILLLLTHSSSPGLTSAVRGEIEKEIRELRSMRDEISEVERWSENEDDRDWIWNRYEADRLEWERMNGDEQFWSLPDHVLDGP